MPDIDASRAAKYRRSSETCSVNPLYNDTYAHKLRKNGWLHKEEPIAAQNSDLFEGNRHRKLLFN